MSDRETGRVHVPRADDMASDAAADDSRLAYVDDTELSSEELDGVGGGRIAHAKSHVAKDEDQGPDGKITTFS